MDILPIQASAVPCERVFSSAKETMTLRRSRIGPDLMEALQMLKFSLRNGRYLDFTAGTTKEEELEALEKEMREELGIPDDTELTDDV
jgi:8-oxo-dGTP pyrophosphatase MutT (NUDIX family)